MKQKKQRKKETPQEFFSNIRIPQGWTFIRANNNAESHGFIYQLSPEKLMRLWYSDSWQGGLCEVDLSSSIYKSIASNKDSSEMNEILTNL